MKEGQYGILNFRGILMGVPYLKGEYQINEAISKIMGLKKEDPVIDGERVLVMSEEGVMGFEYHGVWEMVVKP